MASEFADKIVETRDRITRMLQDASAPPNPWDRIHAAFSRSMGNGSFAEELQKRTSPEANLQRAGQEMELYRGAEADDRAERGLQVQELGAATAARKVGVDEAQATLALIKQAADAGNADAKATNDALQLLVEDEAGRAQVAQHMHSTAGYADTGVRNATARVAQAIKEVGYVPQAKPPTVQDFTEGDQTVKKQWVPDPNGGGTWAYLSGGSRTAPDSPRPQNIILPGEKTTRAGVIKNGALYYTDDENHEIRAPAGTQLAQQIDPNSPTGMEVTLPDGTTVKTGVTGTEATKLTDAKAQAINTVRSGVDLYNTVLEYGDQALSFTGATARLIDTITAQAKALAKAADIPGFQIPASDRFHWADTLAGQSSEVKSKITALAYSVSLMANGTRPTDKDVQNAIDMIGGNSGSGTQLAGALLPFLKSGMDGFAVNWKVKTGQKFDWDAAMEEFGIPNVFTAPTGRPGLDDALTEAKAAIGRGADPNAVIQRLTGTFGVGDTYARKQLGL